MLEGRKLIHVKKYYDKSTAMREEYKLKKITYLEIK